MTATTTITEITPKRRIRAVFYAVNGLGLGHLTRLIALCRAMQAQNPLLDALFITTSEADNLLNKYGIPYVHLPSKNLASQSGSLTYRRLARLYSAVVNPVFDVFQPNILVVDTMVTGSMQDLLNVLRFGNFFKVYVHRARKLEAYEDYTIQAQRFYDLVLTPHYRDTEVIPMPAGFNVPLYWSGPLMLTHRHEAHTRQIVRTRFGIQEHEKLVLISLGGGGDDTNPQTLDFLLRMLAPIPDIKLLFAEGLLRKEAYQGLGNVLVTSEYPVSRLLDGVDFAFASAGYNTFHELLYFGVPTMFVPKLRGYDDQVLRATRAADKGACLVAVEDENFEAIAQQHLGVLLDNEKRQHIAQAACQYVPENHVQEAADAIWQAWQLWDNPLPQEPISPQEG
ncbi:Predicted glycosyl transferase [Flexibacter flexilis DSM 6793]|uniref:Predicted glycosyl transferase n=2 Tax=Flexibacter flexilis TaxID=998 RepID=A0A1I1HQG9_9BACT|nr:Predicted glycosyl transferase [Flexibacter flexilis DSM 6793]